MSTKLEYIILLLVTSFKDEPTFEVYLINKLQRSVHRRSLRRFEFIMLLKRRVPAKNASFLMKAVMILIFFAYKPKSVFTMGL